MRRLSGARFFYGWVVVVVTVLTLIASAGVRSALSVMIHPLEVDLGWSRATISFAASIGLLLYGAVGPLAGWLMDRFGPRLVMLGGLAVFAVLFGLDYIATVPPTTALVADIFGRRHIGAVFGWVFCAHQIGAALAAWLGGVARDYGVAFLAAGALAIVAAGLSLRIGHAPAAARIEAAGA